jgi:hypothetical protein
VTCDLRRGPANPSAPDAYSHRRRPSEAAGVGGGLFDRRGTRSITHNKNRRFSIPPITESGVHADFQTIVTPLLTFAGGLVTALIGEPLRHRVWRPKLRVSFGISEEYIAPTREEFPGGEREARYVRLKVVNRSQAVARDCRAFLTNIERETPPGKFERTIFSDTLQLPWSVRPDGGRAEDLPHGVANFVDVISTREGNPTFRIHGRVFPFRYEHLLSDYARYRLTVWVTGDNVKPVKIKLFFSWKGAWNAFEAAQA